MQTLSCLLHDLRKDWNQQRISGRKGLIYSYSQGDPLSRGENTVVSPTARGKTEAVGQVDLDHVRKSTCVTCSEAVIDDNVPRPASAESVLAATGSR